MANGHGGLRSRSGSTRTGPTRGRGVRNNRNRPWREDVLIRERMELVHKMWVEGAQENEMLVAVNKWAAVKIPSHPMFGRSTIQTDKKNLLALIDEESAELRTEHLESLRHLKNRAYKTLDQPGLDDMAKPGLMNVIRAAEETGAKIDGSLVHRTESKVMMTNDMQARILVQVLVKHLGSEDIAFKVLDEVQGAIEAAAKSSE